MHHDDTFNNTGNTFSGNTVAFGTGGDGGDPDDNDGNDGTATNPDFNLVRHFSQLPLRSGQIACASSICACIQVATGGLEPPTRGL